MTNVTVQQAVRAAMDHHTAGRLAEAESIYRQVLAVQPDHPDALHWLGVIVGNAGQFDQAAELLQKAISAAPSDPAVHRDWGDLLQKHGQFGPAVAAYQRALAIHPNYVDAHNNLGLAWKEKGESDKSIACFQRALTLNPSYTAAQVNLANAHLALEHFDQAIAGYQKALALQPAHAQALCNLGAAHAGKGELDKAIACFQRALTLQPNLAEAHFNFGNVWRDKGQLDQTIASYRQAVAARPDYVEALNNLGQAHKELGQLDLADACYRKTLASRQPASAHHQNLLFSMPFNPAYDAQAILQECRTWNRLHAQPLAKHFQPHTNNRDPARRLRIGYVSPDFRDHCQSLFTVPLLEHHDRAAFEIVAYSSVKSPDHYTRRLQAHTDLWRDISTKDDAKVADLIRSDRIDILVDLTMHMANNRILVFARKPAPIQVCWLAYPGTTGLETIDYRLTDPYLDPPDSPDDRYSERSVRLPDTFWCYDPLTDQIPINSLPSQANGFITFGCLNNFCKVTDAVILLWAKVLNAIPRSRMILLAPQGSARQRVLDRLRTESISPDRIDFVGLQPRATYLRTCHRIDIALDTFPYNGHTTSLDSYWMGVPVVTLVGNTIVGRAGLSQLTNLSLADLVAYMPDQYVQIAAELAADPTRLADLRAGLRDRMRQSPLMDAAKFARGIERAYRTMWQEWCATKTTNQ